MSPEEDARLALNRIDTHEQVCAQRWIACNSKLDAITKHLWAATTLTIVTLLGAVGTLFMIVVNK